MIIFGFIIVLVVGIFTGIIIAHDIAENRRLDATSVTLKSENYLTIPFGAEAKVSDFIEHLSGSIVDDFKISTDALGPQNITFEYINIKNRRRKKSFTITVADVTPPRIYGKTNYTVSLGYNEDLTNLMLSGDDLDDHPVREIIGEYDTNKIGNYPLEYRITDASGNSTSHPFMLSIVAPTPNTNVPNSTSQPSNQVPIAKIIQQYKTPQTKIGIDVSSWQGNIDWAAVRASSVEFAILRIGYGYDNQCIMDKTFQANLAGATAVGLPIGVYFYSYANSIAEAEAEAHWVSEQVKDYQLELGIVFDWEDWTDFNQYNISFRTLNQIAQGFLDTATSHGHRATLYGSKYYLEQFWQPQAPVWLAQYYDRPTYTGEYWLWQMSDNGQIDGITAPVDINIMYLDSATP